MVESSGLLNRRRVKNSTGGSNPPLSASSSEWGRSRNKALKRCGSGAYVAARKPEGHIWLVGPGTRTVNDGVDNSVQPLYTWGSILTSFVPIRQKTLSLAFARSGTSRA